MLIGQLTSIRALARMCLPPASSRLGHAAEMAVGIARIITVKSQPTCVRRSARLRCSTIAGIGEALPASLSCETRQPQKNRDAAASTRGCPVASHMAATGPTAAPRVWRGVAYGYGPRGTDYGKATLRA